jgi:hypothetical protein
MTIRNHRWASVLLVAAVAIGAAACSGGNPSVPPGSQAPAASADGVGGGASPLPEGFPLGSWVTTITEADLRAAGLTAPGELTENAGTFTMSLGADGAWTVSQVADVPIRWPVFRGTYTATGTDGFRQVTEFPADFAGDVVDYGWRMEDGALRLQVRTPPDQILPIIMETHPWAPAG